MSREATAWVWDHAPVNDPRQLLILLSLADVANEHGENAYPSAARMGRDARSDERTVRRHLAALVEAGVIEVTAERRHHRPTTYRFVALARPDKLTGLNEPEDPSDRTQTGHRPDTDRTNGDGALLVGELEPEPDKSAATPDNPDAVRLCERLADDIAERGAKRPTVTRGWVVEMDRLIRLDGRDPDRIERTLGWLNHGADPISNFWQGNVRSPAALRQQWDRMHEQYRNRQRAPRAPARDQGALAYVDDLKQTEARTAIRALTRELETGR